MKRLLLLLLLLAGCSSTRQITDLRELLPEQEASLPHHHTLSTVLRRYFTDEAFDLIEDIPVIDGPAVYGYAAGTTFLSNVASLISGNGWGRKVILPREFLTEWGVEGILHEYFHHIDDMCRDGESDLLDHEEFPSAFAALERDFAYAWIAINTRRKVSRYPWFFHAFLSIGDYSEEMAYTAGQMAARQKGPVYMKKVFRRVFRFPSSP